MKNLTLLGAAIFLLFGYSQFASASCGSIIIPAFDGYEELVEEITDCDNPFGVTNEGFPMDIIIAGIVVEPNIVIPIPSEGTTEYTREGSYEFYRHEDDDYVYFNTYPDGPKPPVLPGTYTVVHKTFELCLVKDSKKESILTKIYNFIIPAAHAQFCFGENKTSAITFILITEEIEEEPTGASSVLFLPGIKASRLYTRSWLGFEDQLWTPNNNGDVRALAMGETGNSINAVYTRDILDSVFGLGNVYAGISNFFNQMVTDEKIASWAPFAYDWRYAVDDIVTEGTQYENERRYVLDLVEQLASESYSGKVTIIGHSNGGLFAKALMTELEKQNKSHLVDRVMFLASPQLGTPKAIGSLLHGYDEDLFFGILLRASVARDAIQNMPGAHALLPTAEYFTATDNFPVVVFHPTDSTESYVDAYGVNITDNSTLQSFLTAELDNRDAPRDVYDAAIINSYLLGKVTDLHTNVLQPWRAPDGVEVIEVAGIGLPTVSGFVYRPYLKRECSLVGSITTCGFVEHYKHVPQFSNRGDETVIAASAAGYRGDKKSYYLDLKSLEDVQKIKHYDFSEATSIQTLISNTLLDEDNPTPFLSNSQQITTSSKIVFGVHSPVLPVVRNSLGQEVKIAFEGDFIRQVEDIPGSHIYYFGDTTYVILPQDDSYEVTLEGTGTGPVTLEIEHLDDNQQTPIQSIFIEEVATSSQLLTTITNDILTDVLLDKDGDGEFDYQINAVTNDVTVLYDNSDEIDNEEIEDDESVVMNSPRKGGYLKIPSATPQVAGMAVSVASLTDIEQVYLKELAELLTQLKVLLDLYEKAITQ